MIVFKTQIKFSENPLLDPNHRSSQIHLFGLLAMIVYSSIEEMNNIEMFRFNIKHADFHRFKHTADPILISLFSSRTKLLRRPIPTDTIPKYSHQALRIFSHIREADNAIISK